MNTNILAGKVVVVTGAASGIGKAVAVQAARHGTGHDIDADPSAHYLMTHHLFQIFTYTSEARPRLIAERIYDDPESYSYEKLAPAEVVTPEMARAQLAPFLARATLD